jgi:hypothetical protein
MAPATGRDADDIVDLGLSPANGARRFVKDFEMTNYS